MTFVKICGVSDPVTARAAAAFGADFVGVIFAPSKRQVTIGQAGRIAESLGQREHVSNNAGAAEIEAALGRRRPLLVGVFADQAADTINDIAEGCGLDLVQLSGSEPWELNEHLHRPILKCLKLRPEETAEDLMTHVHDDAIVLLDPYVEGAYGGTGVTLDWSVAASIARQTPTMLAGGLTPANVADAVRDVQPWAVDVSSGVETDGAKDPAKIRSFIAAAKAQQDVRSA
jgi:phosphoribosylanthranilate isomerase